MVYLEAREEGITVPGPGEGDDAETVVFDSETLIFSVPEDTGDPQLSTSTGVATRSRHKRN